MGAKGPREVLFTTIRVRIVDRDLLSDVCMPREKLHEAFKRAVQSLAIENLKRKGEI